MPRTRTSPAPESMPANSAQVRPICEGRLGARVANTPRFGPPRGGFTVDIEWKDGKVTAYRIAAKEVQPVNVRVNGEVKTVNAERLKE